MSVIRMSKIKGEINSKGFLTKTLISHKNAAVRNILLDVGDVIPPHAVPVDVFFYVIKGKGTIVIGEDENLVDEGDIIVCPPNVFMSVKADQGVNFSFLNIKTPSL